MSSELTKNEEAAVKLWDSIRLPLMDLYFEDRVSKAQVRVIHSIFWEAWRRASPAEGYEGEVIVKDFQVNPLGGGRWSVVLRMSREDWAGTMADVLCETYGHFFVGPRGGVVAKTSSKHSTSENQRTHPLIYGWA